MVILKNINEIFVNDHLGCEMKHNIIPMEEL